MKKGKGPKGCNPVARALRDSHFSQRKLTNKKAYKRKGRRREDRYQ